MYIYFCEKCNKFDAFKSKMGNFKCPDCGGVYLSLGVTVDEWNAFSNDQMLDAIERAQKPVIKTPVFNEAPELVQNIEDDRDFEPIDQIIPKQQRRYADARPAKPKNDKPIRSIPGMIVGIISFIAVIIAWIMGYLVESSIPTFIVGFIAFILAVVAFVMRAKLRAFPIITIVCAVALFIILGLYIVLRALGFSPDGKIESANPTRPVTYGRVTITVPGEFWDEVKTEVNAGTYSTKNEKSNIALGVRKDINISDTDFNSNGSLLSNAFLQDMQYISNVVEKSSHYTDTKGLRSLIIQYEGTRNGKSAILKTAVINDPTENCVVVIMHDYYAADEDKYGNIFEQLLNTVTVEEPKTPIYDSYEEDPEDSEPQTIELAGLNFTVMGMNRYDIHNFTEESRLPDTLGNRELFFVTMNQDNQADILKNYTDNDIETVNEYLQNAGIEQTQRMRMPKAGQTDVKEGFGQAGEYAYYLRNYGTSLNMDYLGVKTITFYTKQPEYNDIIGVVIYIYDKDNVPPNDDIFEKTIESTGLDIEFVEYPEADNSDDKSSTISSESAGGVDPQLKAALDDYEAFMDKYVAFMKKYKSTPDNAISMLGEYTEIVAQYAEYVEKIDAYEKKKNDMSKEDLKYFLDVTNRVEKKMIDVIQ